VVGGTGWASDAVFRVGSLLSASRARTLATSHAPSGSGAMRPERCAFCSAVCEIPSRRATSRCEATRPDGAAAIMM
jgi:hypothetical protein